MKYLLSISFLCLLVFSGCSDEKKAPVVETKQEPVVIKDEAIQKVADDLKDKTADVIDTAAKMAEELSKESKVIAQDVEQESKKVITKIAKDTKEITDVAVEKINEAKANLNTTIEQVIEDEKNTKPQFFVAPSTENNTEADPTNSESPTTEESASNLSSEENTQAKNLYMNCSGCHGDKGEKSALNKSEIISNWDASKILEALQGYKAGTYGGMMKGLMQNQVKNLTDEQLSLLADYISTLK